jgi:hypothetical protein
MAYEISWPANVPTLKIGQTLTVAYHGLPDVWNQLSVESLYQQSARNGHGDSVTLFDPVVAHGVAFAASDIETLKGSRRAVRELTSNKVRFPDLPPSLYPRLYYDPDRGVPANSCWKGNWSRRWSARRISCSTASRRSKKSARKKSPRDRCRGGLGGGRRLVERRHHPIHPQRGLRPCGGLRGAWDRHGVCHAGVQ